MTALIRELKEEDFEECLCFLRDHYFPDEPLWQQYPEEICTTIENPMRREYRLSIIRQGTSLVALDPDNGQFLGLALAGVLHQSELVHNEQSDTVPTRLAQMLRFITNVEVCANIFGTHGVNEALYLYYLGVNSIARRQGLGKRLVTQLIEVGRSKGFPLIAATCTSLYSWKLLRSFGMKCIFSQNYADYKDEDGNVVFKPQAPHTKVYVVTMPLQELCN